MTVKQLIKAEDEARRFLATVHELMKKYPKSVEGSFWASKESGAVRRSSMDLTRALAELRKY